MKLEGLEEFAGIVGVLEVLIHSPREIGSSSVLDDVQICVVRKSSVTTKSPSDSSR